MKKINPVQKLDKIASFSMYVTISLLTIILLIIYAIHFKFIPRFIVEYGDGILIKVLVFSMPLIALPFSVVVMIRYYKRRNCVGAPQLPDSEDKPTPEGKQKLEE